MLSLCMWSGGLWTQADLCIVWRPSLLSVSSVTVDKRVSTHTRICTDLHVSAHSVNGPLDCISQNWNFGISGKVFHRLDTLSSARQRQGKVKKQVHLYSALLVVGISLSSLRHSDVACVNEGSHGSVPRQSECTSCQQPATHTFIHK